MALIGNSTFARMRSLRWALISYNCVLIKRGNLDTHIDMHREKTVKRHRKKMALYKARITWDL